MRKLLLALLLAASPVVAQAATTTLDPLHIECTGCVDNGTNTPLPTSTSQFGFSSSPPGTTGTLFLIALVPDTMVVPAPSINVLAGGFLGGVTGLVSATPWTAGTLAGYFGANGFGNLNVNASPDNGIGAYLPSTQALDGAGVTGFDVFIRNVGSTGPGGLSGPGVFPSSDLFQLGGNLPIGSYIIAALINVDARTGDISVFNTANSGAGFVTTFSTSPVPIPGALPLFASGIGGLLLLLKKKKQKQPLPL